MDMRPGLSNDPKPSRRWFQFSTRTLLALMLLFACGFGWVAYERQQTRKRQAATKVIENAGGWVTDNDEEPSTLTSVRAFMGGDNEDIVIAVCLSKTRITDAGLAQLKALTNIKWLELDSTQVSDAGLVHLEGFSQLDYLDLSGTQVSDTGVRNLQQALPKVTIIR